ncbi:MAG: prepilin-type N-terminal cleavage/methylation domain-containing protein [Acutalibacteraceae bacterium]
MTFQQKMLMKNSKKAFTLVELVVVIAILSILAAIAIPMVTGIIQNATDSAKGSDAFSLNQACKTFLTSVAVGTITQESISTAGITYTGTTLPKKTDTQLTKNSIANNLLVKDAANFNGLDDVYASISDFGYINGNTGSAVIIYKATADSGVTVSNITDTTKLSDIYGKIG